MQSKRIYQYQGVSYEATITYRKGRSFTLRLGQENTLRVGVPLFVLSSDVDKFVINNLPKLLSKIDRFDKDIDENGYYLFGQHMDRMGLSDAQIRSYLKKELLEYVSERSLYYEALMDISPAYKISVRDMSTRYGVNSYGQHKITYALSLAHYSRQIIDAIIVHELAHHFHRNHQKKFYDVVYQYCPNYDMLHKKLREHIHG